jgi:hypothetical protein
MVTRYFKAEKASLLRKVYFQLEKFCEKNMFELFLLGGGFASLRGLSLFSSLFFAKSLIFG